ncbi:exodeoxyribonuclease V subunit alpha [Marinomonas ostreistagni]|uniref:RecBCD enzyme subunit RecD n=1 Tax=Marinomonas ostreistagni TaxID=359209 RepID=A0ABS0Z7N1_9GAMM|nr:exodeoxyribonuclease V subunit alpha [Marinomonas ostreistagni]MBJ7549674.1 exodeoxyribonuclease V subunit alpha [Marinomonas ostreistagni]
MSNVILMKSWVDEGLIRYVDYALVKFIQEQTQNVSDEALLAIMLTSHSVALGQVCINLEDVINTPEVLFSMEEGDDEAQQIARVQMLEWVKSLSLKPWINAIKVCSAVAVADASGVVEGGPNSPLVLVESNGSALLYLRRYWQAEDIIVKAIRARLMSSSQIDDSDIRSLLADLFAGNKEFVTDTDWQRIACGIAASNHFSIITGGPGTGKTTTVLKLLALLQAERLKQALPPLAIRLAAPTGKAAARLNESIADNLQRLQLPEFENIQPEDLKAVIPTQVMTLHRLLKPKPNTRQFMHNKANPLVADIVVVDEASMIDIEMMASLFEGIEPTTRVILLGDKDQLASVEAGYVLGDLCRGALEGHYTPDTMEWIKNVCGEEVSDDYRDEQGSMLNQAVCMLRKSYRFLEGGVIHRLASLVNEERDNYLEAPKMDELKEIFAEKDAVNSVPVLRLLTQPQHPDSALETSFKTLLTTGYGHYLDVVAQMPQTLDTNAFDQWGKKVLQAHTNFQLLVALRKGDWGLEGMNDQIERLLVSDKKLMDTDSLWYLGRPVMVTQNDYSVDLMNGDIGISLRYPVNGELKQRVVFSDGKGGVRWVLPSRLQSVETVFAMTVHKSQGSEFHHTAMLLPSQSSPILTKELIYTGITRSKKHFTLISGGETVLEEAMNRKVERKSGLSLYIS